MANKCLPVILGTWKPENRKTSVVCLQKTIFKGKNELKKWKT